MVEVAWQGDRKVEKVLPEVPSPRRRGAPPTSLSRVPGREALALLAVLMRHPGQALGLPDLAHQASLTEEQAERAVRDLLGAELVRGLAVGQQTFYQAERSGPAAERLRTLWDWREERLRELRHIERELAARPASALEVEAAEV